jgi:heme-degrading monooxygenase HmoA
VRYEEAIMYSRTIVAKLVPGTADEALRTFRDEVVPVVQQQPGYISTSLFLDRENNRAMTVSVWETAAAESATSTASDYLRKVVGKMSPYLVNRDVDSWEIAYDDR